MTIPREQKIREMEIREIEISETQELKVAIPLNSY